MGRGRHILSRMLACELLLGVELLRILLVGVELLVLVLGLELLLRVHIRGTHRSALPCHRREVSLAWRARPSGDDGAVLDHVHDDIGSELLGVL